MECYHHSVVAEQINLCMRCDGDIAYRTILAGFDRVSRALFVFPANPATFIMYKYLRYKQVTKHASSTDRLTNQISSFFFERC